MKIACLFSVLALAATSLAQSARTLTITYDPGYDKGARSMNAVACSNGANGLETRYGWKKQSDIPTFPRIGGSVDISGFNSPFCGTCYRVTYKGKSIYALGIDHTSLGLNLSVEAFQALTGVPVSQVGKFSAQVTKVGVSFCGLTAKRNLREIEFMA